RLETLLEAARGAVGGSPRMGAGPTRFIAVAAASRARPRRPEVIRSSTELAREPVGLLGLRDEAAELPEPLERLGIVTLGELAALPRAALADRFGMPGLLAADLVAGADTQLRPRLAVQRLEETLELPESGSGEQLERA